MMKQVKAAVLAIDTKQYQEKQKQGNATMKAVAKVLKEQGVSVKGGVLPKDLGILTKSLETLISGKAVQLLFTIGALGLEEDDCAPEAVSAVTEKSLPGVAEVVRGCRIEKEPKAMLERGVAGLAEGTILVNLPEDEEGAVASLQAILPELLTVAERAAL